MHIISLHMSISTNLSFCYEFIAIVIGCSKFYLITVIIVTISFVYEHKTVFS